MTREYTNKLLEMVEEGLLDPIDTLKSALCWMSEYDVEEMFKYIGLDVDLDEDTEDETEDEE